MAGQGRHLQEAQARCPVSGTQAGPALALLMWELTARDTQLRSATKDQKPISRGRETGSEGEGGRTSRPQP